MNNLTKTQQKLVDDLINEFEKINPKPTLTSEIKRFGLDTITNCINEKERLIRTMSAYNESVKSIFLKQFDDEIKTFKKEFGKVLDIQIGTYRYGGVKYDKKELFNNTISDTHEIKLFIVSKKSQASTSCNSYKDCNGMANTEIFVSFKLERVKDTLESGEIVSLDRIVGLNYSRFGWLHKAKSSYPTLDALIQSEKGLQQRIVDLAK